MINHFNKSERQLRVAQLIKMAIIDALRKYKMPDIRLTSENIIVTDVTISSDLKFATCYVRLMDMIETKSIILDQYSLIEALEQTKYHMRKWIAHNVSLKYVPEIDFCYDQSPDKLSHIEQLIEKTK